MDWLIGAHITPGHPDNINPYISELGGILAIVVVAKAIAQLMTSATKRSKLDATVNPELRPYFNPHTTRQNNLIMTSYTKSEQRFHSAS
jgi:hypothetical protein